MEYLRIIKIGALGLSHRFVDQVDKLDLQVMRATNRREFFFRFNARRRGMCHPCAMERPNNHVRAMRRLAAAAGIRSAQTDNCALPELLVPCQSLPFAP